MKRTILPAIFPICGVLLMVCGCEERKAPPHAAARGSGQNLPAREPDIRTVAAIVNKQDSKAGPTMPAGHPAMGGTEQTESPAGAMPPGHPAIGSAEPAIPAEGTLPAGHPSIGMPATPDLDKPPTTGPNLKFDAPPTWKSKPVSSAMRKAQYELPRAAGDNEDGQLVVYYFGPDQGGTVESNIERWQGMFTDSAGKPVGGDKAKRATTQVGGMNVTTLDVTGRYADAMGRPGKAGPTDVDFRLLAAVVETQNGSWFFKAVGPVATMSSHAEEFQQFLKTLRR